MAITKTYAILDIEEDSFQDILERLDATGTLNDYLREDTDSGCLIVFGTVALRSEDDPAASP